MDNIKIEKLPKQKTIEWVDSALDKMEIGDCFFVPDDRIVTIRTIRKIIWNYGQKNGKYFRLNKDLITGKPLVYRNG